MYRELSLTSQDAPGMADPGTQDCVVLGPLEKQAGDTRRRWPRRVPFMSVNPGLY